MDNLKAELKALKRTINEPEPENTDAVDFYELYNALTIKRSGMEEHKPLSTVAHYKNDQFSMVIAGYFNLCCALYKARFGDLKKKQGGQKTRLDASLTEFLYMLGERESPEVVEVVSKFIQERMSKNTLRNNQFPLSVSYSQEDSIIAKVETLLPTRSVVRMYLEYFYKIVYPFFPYVDRKAFDAKVFSIVVAPAEDSPISLKIDDRFDLIIISILLIIMRLTHISLPPSFNDQIFNRYPINTEYISEALAILSLFKITRKTKLALVQALFYLRLYLMYAPEDGDGSELTQSQTLFSMIVQSAYTIGLNRDASNHTQMNFDKDHANLWRRIWLGILEVDRTVSTLAGHICLVQNLNSYKVDFPHLDEADLPLDRAIVEEYQRSEKLLKMYYDLGNMVNNIASSPRVCEIMDLLKRMQVYVQINYSILDMRRLSESAEAEKDMVNFNNSKKIMHNFILRGLQLAVFQSLSLHYESMKHQDSSKMKEFFQLNLQITIEVSNLSYKLLTNQYADYVDANHRFYLNRYIENVFQRSMNSLISLIIRLYHSLDLLSRGIGLSELIPTLTDTVDITFRVLSGMNVLMQNALGIRYYQAFKMSLKYKFYVRSLRKEGYKCIRDTIDFINAKFLDDPIARLNMLQRIDLKMSPATALIELDSMNQLVNTSTSFLESLGEMMQTAEILNDEMLSSEDIIWEPSFKALPQTELRGATPIDDATLLRGLGVDELDPATGHDTQDTSGLINLDQLLTVNGPLDFEQLLRRSDENYEWLSKL
jgi:hypothetical protein